MLQVKPRAMVRRAQKMLLARLTRAFSTTSCEAIAVVLRLIPDLRERGAY